MPARAIQGAAWAAPFEEAAKGNESPFSAPAEAAQGAEESAPGVPQAVGFSSLGA